MNTWSEKLKRSVWILAKDLELFASVYVAHFIVWRELRRERREDSARRKNFNVRSVGV